MPLQSPSCIDTGLGHVTGFGQWDISKCTEAEAFKESPCALGFVLLQHCCHQVTKSSLAFLRVKEQAVPAPSILLPKTHEWATHRSQLWVLINDVYFKLLNVRIACYRAIENWDKNVPISLIRAISSLDIFFNFLSINFLYSTNNPLTAAPASACCLDTKSKPHIFVYFCGSVCMTSFYLLQNCK